MTQYKQANMPIKRKEDNGKKRKNTYKRNNTQ